MADKNTRYFSLQFMKSCDELREIPFKKMKFTTNASCINTI